MGSTAPVELGLDLKLCAEKAVDGLLNEDPTIGLEETLKGLEEERTKIEAFKRELPFSIRVVAKAIEIMKEQLEQFRGEGCPPRHCDVLEEFIPIRSKFEEDGGVKPEKDFKDKMNWMSSAQLWSDNYSENYNKSSNNIKRNMEEESETPSLESKSRSGGGGAFVPFNVHSVLAASSRNEEKPAMALPDLSLLSAGIKASRPVPAVAHEHRYGGGSDCKGVGRAPASSPAAGGHLSLQAQQQLPRKARRCWSPELHRRFVLSLQQLGGAQVATPKQIRELMKVDGLTNDEVKSHLQKYRLHTRRTPNSSAPVNRPVVMLGGLWVPQDHYTASQQSASQSGSPQSPLQLAGSARAVSVTAGDSCEEDGKSESYSWK